MWNRWIYRANLPDSSKQAPVGENRKFPVWCWYSSTVREANLFSVSIFVRIYHIYYQIKDGTVKTSSVEAVVGNTNSPLRPGIPPFPVSS